MTLKAVAKKFPSQQLRVKVNNKTPEQGKKYVQS